MSNRRPRSQKRGNQNPRSRAGQSDLAKAPLAGAPSGYHRPVLWISLGLIAANVVVYSAVRSYGFVNFDDLDYVRQNATVAAGLTQRGVLWAFTTGYAANWHPLTWL